MDNYVSILVEKICKKKFNSNYPHLNYVLDGIYEEISKANTTNSEPVLLGELEKKLKNISETRTNERKDQIIEAMKKTNSNNRLTGGISEAVTDEEIQENLDYYKNFYSDFVKEINSVLIGETLFDNLTKEFEQNNKNISKQYSSNFIEMNAFLKPFYDGKRINLDNAKKELKNYSPEVLNWREILQFKNRTKEYAQQLNEFISTNIVLNQYSTNILNKETKKYTSNVMNVVLE